MNSGKIIAPPYANTMFMIPFTFANRGPVPNVCVITGPCGMLKDAMAEEKFGGECATTPMVMNMSRRFSHTALNEGKLV